MGLIERGREVRVSRARTMTMTCAISHYRQSIGYIIDAHDYCDEVMQKGHIIGFVRSVRLGRRADASKDGAMVRWCDALVLGCFLS